MRLAYEETGDSIDDRPLDVSEHLRVSEELSEVDVEDVSGVFDHDVVVVSVTDSQHVRRHAVTSAARREVLHRLHNQQHALYTADQKKTGIRFLEHINGVDHRPCWVERWSRSANFPYSAPYC